MCRSDTQYLSSDTMVPTSPIATGDRHAARVRYKFVSLSKIEDYHRLLANGLSDDELIEESVMSTGRVITITIFKINDGELLGLHRIMHGGKNLSKIAYRDWVSKMEYVHYATYRYFCDLEFVPSKLLKMYLELGISQSTLLSIMRELVRLYERRQFMEKWLFWTPCV